MTHMVACYNFKNVDLRKRRSRNPARRKERSMPKEGESLYKNDPKVEFQTKTQQDELTANRDLTIQQSLMTDDVPEMMNTESVIQVVRADQFAPMAEQEAPQVTVDFSVKGNVLLEDDSSRMRSLKNAVASFYSKQEIYNRREEKNLVREKNLDDLLNQAEEIISDCKWYCLFRHPITTKGKKRKAEVKKLQTKMREQLEHLRQEKENLKASTEKPLERVELKEGESTALSDLAAEYATLSEELKLSTKGGFLGSFRSNSPEFDRVIRGLEETNRFFAGGVPASIEALRTEGGQLLNALQQGIDATDAYLKKQGGSSTAGGVRRKLVEKARQQLIADRSKLSSGLDLFQTAGMTVPKGFSWGVLVRSRMIKTDVDLEGLKQYGGAMSKLYEFTPKEDTYGGGLFKIDESVQLNGRDKIFREGREQAMLALEKDGYILSDEMKHQILESKDINLKAVKTRGPLLHIVKKYISYFTDTKIMELQQLQDLEMQEKQQPGGETGINPADRDVATYRIATLFGQSKLVARSEKVILQGKDGEIHGHMMDKVTGQSGAEFIADIIEKKVESGKDSTVQREDFKGRITGGFIKDLNNLMVLDYICGQTDRHSGNYIVKTDESGKLTTIVGIDNNMAFPADGADELNSGTILGLVTKGGDLRISHMDAELGATILAVRPEMIRQVLCDLLTEDEIDQTLKRLNKLQMAIKRELDKGNSSLFLSKDSEWLEKEDDVKKLKGTNERTYLGSFFNDGMGAGDGMYMSKVYNQKGEEWILSHQNLKAPEFMDELEKVLSMSVERSYFRELIFLKEKDGQPLDLKGIFIDHKGLSSTQIRQCSSILFAIGEYRSYHNV